MPTNPCNPTEELICARRELANCRSEFSEFVYAASHDLREPLRGIRNYASFLSEDYAPVLGKDGIDRLKTMRDLADRMDRQIDALLTISRVSNAELQRDEIDLQTLIDSVWLNMKPLLAERDAKIITTGLPLVHCDPAWAAQLLGQLMTNAVLFNNSPAICVEVGHYGTDAAECAVFFVRDNGIGIEGHQHSEVMKLFSRLHARDAYGAGIGAGLTIAAKIAERHGGRLWLNSAPSEGTTFFFTFGSGL